MLARATQGKVVYAKHYKVSKESTSSAPNNLHNFPLVKILDTLSNLYIEHEENEVMMAVVCTKQSALTEKINLLSSKVVEDTRDGLQPCMLLLQ